MATQNPPASADPKADEPSARTVQPMATLASADPETNNPNARTVQPMATQNPLAASADDPEAGTFPLSLRDVFMKTVVVDVTPETKMYEVKEAVRVAKGEEGVEYLDAMVLLYEHQPLDDDSTVASHGLSRETIVTLSATSDVTKGRALREGGDALRKAKSSWPVQLRRAPPSIVATSKALGLELTRDHPLTLVVSEVGLRLIDAAGSKLLLGHYSLTQLPGWQLKKGVAGKAAELSLQVLVGGRKEAFLLATGTGSQRSNQSGTK